MESRIWLRAAGSFRPYRWRVCGVASLAVASVALNMVSPLLLRQVIDSALPHRNARLLVILCTAMVVSSGLSTAIAMGLNALTNWIGQQVVHQLRIDLYDRVQRMPLNFFSSEPTSEIQARIANDIGGISDFLTYTTAGTLTAVMSILAAGLVMLIMSWQLAAFSVVLAVGLGMFNRRYMARRRDLAVQRQQRMSTLLQLVGDDLTLSGIILGRTFLRYARQRSRFSAASEQVSALTYRQRVAGGTARGVVGLAMSCLPPMIYLLAGTAVHGLTAGTAVVMVMLQARLTGPIQQLLQLNGQMQSSQAMFTRIFEYLDLPPAVSLRLEGHDVAVRHGPETLRARAIWHRYPDAGRVSLSAIDMDLPPGSTTLIAGHTGSGKSTLALVLAGLIEPSGGMLEWIDRRLPSPGSERPVVTCHEMWEEVTLVAQDTALFNASIRENLLFARPDATDRQLLEIAGAMQLGQLIAQLPGGLDTTVGEHGYQLSGGERQRLALARALLLPSRVLITDEATSALDPITAAAVDQALRELCAERALVIIAHRIPHMESADQVIVLEDGHVVGQGQHGNLAATCPPYRELLAGQVRAVPALDRRSASSVIPERLQSLRP
jgi:ATP-binding cassette, subfamily B, bacterial